MLLSATLQFAVLGRSRQHVFEWFDYRILIDAGGKIRVIQGPFLSVVKRREVNYYQAARKSSVARILSHAVRESEKALARLDEES